MSQSKTIISGCGLSWSGQERKTWVHVLRLIGADIIDVGGPAVSNQWIMNRAIAAVLDTSDITRVIIQLTNLGKLDVEIFGDRLSELVQQDSMRNFVVDGIWPSSTSTEHPSKKLWGQWLFSPRLEIQDIQVKTRLLEEFCGAKNIELILMQGYPISWQQYQADHMLHRIENPDQPWYEDYKNSARYQYHDHIGSNAVPELGWQIQLAKKMSLRFWPQLTAKISKLQDAYFKTRSEKINVAIS